MYTHGVHASAGEKNGAGKGHFSSTCVHVCVCAFLGLNMLALQHVCSLSRQADRQRGQTGCYKTQPGEKKGNPGEERVKGYAYRTNISCTLKVHNVHVCMCMGL